jgi:PEP-CTERM motif
MPRKRRLNLAALFSLILCASILSAVPARADTRYAFSSKGGGFIYDSSSFVGVGSVPVSALRSFSGDFEAVFFGHSDITLVNRVCSGPGDCFDAAFNLDGIFQTLGDYVAADGATLDISEVTKGAPIPEPSSWAMLAVGFAGLAFAGNRRIWGPRLRLSDPLPMRRA